MSNEYRIQKRSCKMLIKRIPLTVLINVESMLQKFYFKDFIVSFNTEMFHKNNQ